MDKHVIAEIKVNYSPRKLKCRTKVNCSQKAYEVFLDTWDHGIIEYQEEFKILLLNHSNEPLGLYTLSRGGQTFAPVDLKILFGVILKSGATGFISVHNHPSGRLRASMQDKALHEKIKKIASFHEVNYLDALIITAKNGYYSFQDEGDF
ncbi:JAB domain-containing protein [Aestuariivivens sediminis]|uniref:JAB domain-containing protein n=1 Tax=Aestuariivivens sediminis TaxID=2913557 RepID=UPI001F5A6D04|nr:JAB domain-containing protein [Aestuariivivens sediminis]